MTLFFPKNLYFRTEHSFMTPPFSRFVLPHAYNNTTFQILGGRMHGPSTTSNFGRPPPQILAVHHLKFFVPSKSPPMLYALVSSFYLTFYLFNAKISRSWSQWPATAERKRQGKLSGYNICCYLYNCFCFILLYALVSSFCLTF